MIYFTSDQHFMHENVLRSRPVFSSIDEMDEALIENWNKTVHQNDTVIIVGDLFYRNRSDPAEYLKILKGKKILVKGNHDLSWLKHLSDEEMRRYFESISEFYALKRDKVKLRFCHYPMISWESSRHGSILICGHIHGRKDGFEVEMFKKVPFAFNAGVDINDYKPVTLAELIENNIIFYGREYSEEECQYLQHCGKAFSK